MGIDVAELATLASTLYLVIVAVAALDAVVPIVPSESVVILGAVLAARGDLSLPGVVACAAAGALAGDLASYALGRRSGRRRRGVDPDGRLGAAVRWASTMLDTRGPGVLVTARFVPGGRTAATFTAGFVGFPGATFAASAAVGAVAWACHGAAMGYLGGHVVERNVLLGTAVGVAVGVAAGAGLELVRGRLGRRRPPLS
jgi:membrane protein DedA with SNARE-associated domain